ncbi:CHASE2 and HATPase_c domain-containing protein [uncultured Erythrobacter sp.]|uniref:CHASE2 and HATPase_c domain-containing protein n=1 Tax=uncultured Erythrobacter sp. TaxID=263913 RepID=UPI0026291584|nr:CHASE2 and HATPase_c domain-containing protein [uncultured Erythrobacter sp.]
MKNFRLFGEWCALLTATLLLVLLAWHQGWTHRLDASVLDLATELRLGDPSDEIVLVEIDDRSLSEIGNWPWDRDRHAELVDQLQVHQPKLIVFDILFLEPTSVESDGRLAESIADAGNVALPHTFAPAPGVSSELQPIFPLDELRAGASQIGHVLVSPDPDGAVRRFALEYQTAGGSYDHLAKVAYLAAGSDTDALPASNSDPIVPMHSGGSFQTFSAADIVDGQAQTDFLRGKIVLIGATAQGLGDRYAVSVHAGRIMTGVEIQANLLSGMLQGELVTEIPSSLVATALILSIVLLFLVFWQLPPKWTLRVSIGLIVALALISVVLVVFAGRWMPVFPAILGILVAYPVWGWRRLSSVSRFLDTEARALYRGQGEPLADGAVGFDPIARQVSQVRGLIGETRERLSFLRSILSASPDPMLVFDKDGELSLLNDRAAEVFGSEAALAGQNLAQLFSERGAVLDTHEQELQLPDGRSFLIASSDIGMSEGGNIVSLRDITSLRSSERQRREMLEFLSHDMRSPQAAIVGLVGAAGQTLPEKERLSRIEKQARRTLKLTDDFVQIARLEYEGVEPQEADIGALLHEAMDRAYPSAKRKRIAFEASIPADPEFCQIDPSSMSRAIDNLIGNAIKFSPDGMKVGVKLERLPSECLRIEVYDSGPGLPEERQKDTFARFGARNTEAGPSAGLGLAYVKRAVDEHGGEISVSSSKEAGTRFVITLPCAEAQRT